MAQSTEPQISPDYPLGEALRAAGQLLPVADGVFWLRLPLPFALNHINLWLLQDGDGWTLVDCGYGSKQNLQLWQSLLDGVLAQQSLSRIIVTHDHPDHIGLADWLIQQTGAALWMSESEFLAAHAVWHDLAGFECAQMVELYRRHAVPRPMLDLLAANGSQYRKGVRTCRAVSTGYCRAMCCRSTAASGRPSSAMAILPNISACIAPASICLFPATCCCPRSAPISASGPPSRTATRCNCFWRRCRVLSRYRRTPAYCRSPAICRHSAAYRLAALASSTAAKYLARFLRRAENRRRGVAGIVRARTGCVSVVLRGRQGNSHLNLLWRAASCCACRTIPASIHFPRSINNTHPLR